MTALFVPALVLLSILSLPEPALSRVGMAAAGQAKAGASSEGAVKAQSNLSAPISPMKREMLYTSNSMCRMSYCTNPIFPGIDDLPKLELLEWQCATRNMVHEHMEFCKDAVLYDPALPSPVSAATPVNQLVGAQEDAAMTMFVYHLNGMGYEAWEYQKPTESDNECVRSIWRMVCFTYFPRAEAGCKQGERSWYKRPCKSSCQNYVKQCGVECCDESVKCDFKHTKTTHDGTVVTLQTGYVDELGPSSACTGSTRRSMSSPWVLLLGVLGFHVVISSQAGGTSDKGAAKHAPALLRRWLALAVFCGAALSLQGCDSQSLQIERHSVGNWRGRPNYLHQFQYLPPNSPNLESAVLNSCSQLDVSASTQCSGRGYCRYFGENRLNAQEKKPISFCQCDRDWADPECSTKRKSQFNAFFLSLFLGFLGADYFYLGFPLWGVAKLLTLGGFGFWWLVDTVRLAAGPVYAYNFRTAHDLPHWAALLVLFFVSTLVGFYVAIEGYMSYRKKKRTDYARLQHDDEEQMFQMAKEDAMAASDGPRFRSALAGAIEERELHKQGKHDSFSRQDGFRGYGSTLSQHDREGRAYRAAQNAVPSGLANPPGHPHATPSSAFAM